MTGGGEGVDTTGTGASSLQRHAARLVGLAESAIDHGLAHGTGPAVAPEEHPEALRTVRPAFVTLLDANGDLRGCVGRVETDRPLAVEVSDNAFAAAFRDPRFPPLAPHERPGVICRLSVLTPLEPVAFSSEAELIRQFRPGLDGLVLETDSARGTFLPAVWEQLPDPREFWSMLKRKAGMSTDAFPPDLRVYRYRAESIFPPDSDGPAADV